MNILGKILRVSKSWLVYLSLEFVVASLVFEQLWGWFIVKIFNLPKINEFQSAAIILILFFFSVVSTSLSVAKNTTECEEEEDSGISYLLTFLVKIAIYLAILGIGWLLTFNI